MREDNSLEDSKNPNDNEIFILQNSAALKINCDRYDEVKSYYTAMVSVIYILDNPNPNPNIYLYRSI